MIAWLAIPQAAPAQPRAEGAGPMLTLADAVAQALVQNDRIRDAHDAVQRAGDSELLARSDFGPKILPNLLGSLGQTDITNQTYGVGFSQRFSTGTDVNANVRAVTSQNQFGDFASSDVTLQVRQSLLRGFGRQVGLNNLLSARLGQADAARRVHLTEQQVAIEVAAAYYAVGGSEQLLEVARLGEDRARQLMAGSQARLLVGRVSRLDVLRAEQLVAEAELRSLDAEAALETARDQLRSLLNWAPDREFRVETEIPVPSAPDATGDPVALALAARPEVASARASVDDADRSVRAARNGLLPQLDVSVALTRRETADRIADSFGLNRFRLATFFEMSAPLDRTPQRVAYRNQLMEANQRRRALQALERQVHVEVRGAMRQQTRLRRALELSERRVELARQELQAARYRYDTGLADTFDMVSAETNLLTSESTSLSLRASLAVAGLQLRATIGVLDPRRDVR